MNYTTQMDAAKKGIITKEMQVVAEKEGINHGDNSSVNVHYSGTMGVVIEGCLKKIPSVGFSLCNHAKMQILRPLSLIYNVS